MKYLKRFEKYVLNGSYYEDGKHVWEIIEDQDNITLTFFNHELKIKVIYDRNTTYISYFNKNFGQWIEIDISNKYRIDKDELFDLAIKFVENHKFMCDNSQLLYDNGINYPSGNAISVGKITLKEYNKKIEKIRVEYDYLISGKDMGLL